MLYVTAYILSHLELPIYIYFVNAFGEHREVEIAIDYEMKLKLWTYGLDT